MLWLYDAKKQNIIKLILISVMLPLKMIYSLYCVVLAFQCLSQSMVHVCLWMLTRSLGMTSVSNGGFIPKASLICLILSARKSIKQRTSPSVKSEKL